MQHFSICMLTMCLLWIDIVPFFCDVTVVTAVSLASELTSFMVSANRTHSSIDNLLNMDADDQRDHVNKNSDGDGDDDDSTIQTSFASKIPNVQNHNFNHYKHHHHQHHQHQHQHQQQQQHYHHQQHHRQNHQHHNHAKRPKHWHAHHFSEPENHDRHHHYETKYIDGMRPSNEWHYSAWQSDETQPKTRRRHEKRWHHQRNYYQFIDHTDQITSKLHADLEIQSSNRMLDGIMNDTENVPIHWPVKKEAIMEGDVILGGLMMVHSRG